MSIHSPPTTSQPETKRNEKCTTSLLLRKLLLPNVTAPQLHIEHSLHRAQHLLIRVRCSPLKVLYHRGCRIAFGRQLLLRHLVSFLIAALLDRVPDL